jgi:hypothetical protein
LLTRRAFVSHQQECTGGKGHARAGMKRGQFRGFSGVGDGDGGRAGQADAGGKPFPNRNLRPITPNNLPRSVMTGEVNGDEDDQQVRDEQGHPVGTGKERQGEESDRPHRRDIIRTASGHIQ